MERPEDKIAKSGVARQIIVRPEAETEVQQAFEWYEEQSKGREAQQRFVLQRLEAARVISAIRFFFEKEEF